METSHCPVSYLLPALEWLAGAELQYCLVVGGSDLQRVGPVILGESESVRLAGEGLAEGAGLSGPVYSRREYTVGWTEVPGRHPLYWGLGPQTCVVSLAWTTQVVRLAKRRTVWDHLISCSSRF